jgi:predicted esterase
MREPTAQALLLASALGCLGPVARAQVPGSSEPRWCAPELEAVSGEVCHVAPSRRDRSPDTLVIFLHGVIEPGTEWQWSQQRAIARAATANGFEALMPRGRRGIGPRGMEDWWTWPTGTRAQQAVENELIEEWLGARRLLEARRDAPFARVVVMGFSNGAYYGASLALRGRLTVDGYALFAGGGAGYLERQAQRVRLRPPIYVGYGARDPVGKKDSQALGATLRRLGWKHRVVGRPSVGHSMTDAQLREAMDFVAGGGKR